jgi:hypothetical protein
MAHKCNGGEDPRQGVNPSHTWIIGGWSIVDEIVPTKNKGG